MNREEAVDRIVFNITNWSSIPEGYGFDHWRFVDNQFVHTIHDPITIHDWNRAKIVPNTKVRILSPEHSDYIELLASQLDTKIEDPLNPHNFKWLSFYSDAKAEYGNGIVVDKEIFIELPALKNPKELLEQANQMLKDSGADINARVLAEKVGSKHSHYFKDVSDLDEVDVYRVCDLFEVNDASGAKQHAIKKLLCSGKRGAKDERKDLEEARDTIIRKLAMMTEDKE